MIIEYNQAKSDRNIAERDLSFGLVANIDMASALIVEDIRNTYPERRFVITGFIDERLYVACITPITGGFRVISFRKANKREVKRYEQQAINP